MKNYRDGYRVIYIGNKWMEIISPNDKPLTYKQALTFWATTSKEWGRKMRVFKMPSYLDCHSFNKGH